MSSNITLLDQPVFRVLGLQAPNQGDIGIEVELEGALPESAPPRSGWRTISEGSLRNGKEFVLARPVAIDTLHKYTANFDKMMAGFKPTVSIRCSTHIHVNIQSFTVRQVYRGAFAYYLLEELLVSTQPTKRRGNLFCLRMSDAGALATDIYTSLTRERLNNRSPLHFFSIGGHKYGALNLAAPKKFGSLEFRFLDALTKGDDIAEWCQLLRNLLHNAKDQTTTSLLESYDQLSARDFVRKLLGPQAEFVIKDKTDAEINSFIHVNYDTVSDLARCLDKHSFQVPSQYWNPDLADEPADARSRLRSPISASTSDWSLTVLASQLGDATDFDGL